MKIILSFELLNSLVLFPLKSKILINSGSPKHLLVIIKLLLLSHKKQAEYKYPFLYTF